jgi:uncharacterized membrane protein YedE/YeeE
MNIQNLLTQKHWSPYLVGTLLGMLSWLTFALSDKALGVSTTFVRATGGVLSFINPEIVQQNAYWAKYLADKPVFEWQFALVIAVAVGAFIAARLSGGLKGAVVPEIWRKAFGTSLKKRASVAFLGGVLLLFGARLAGGCTSGHGLSGGLQLALSGYVFIASAFAAGIPVAMILYKKQKDN